LKWTKKKQQVDTSRDRVMPIKEAEKTDSEKGAERALRELNNKSGHCIMAPIDNSNVRSKTRLYRRVAAELGIPIKIRKMGDSIRIDLKKTE